MPTAMETITNVEDQVVGVISAVQEPVVGLVGKVAEYVAGVLPEDLPELPFADQVPSVDEIVDNGFAFAQRLLDAQQEFTKAVLGAAAPLLRTETKAPKAKPAAAKTVKAA